MILSKGRFSSAADCEGANTYELRKFNRADWIYISPGAWAEIEKLERWPGECRRFRRKPNIRGSALVTAKGSRRAERAGFLVVTHALI